MDSNNVRSRKRKNCRNVEEDEDEDDEETKIEKFFGLIERFREAREKLIMEHKGLDKNDNNNNNDGVMNKKKKQVWEPRFQLEDFAQEPKDLAGMAFNNKEKLPGHHHQKQETIQSLDLRLSL